MIQTLHIKNIGIIEDVTVNFREGFHVFTGETGAGKTLMIDSLQILAGGRFSKEMIRNGQTNSFVEMSVYLPNLGYEEDTVIISREINIHGKNICKINGRLVTVSELKMFMNQIMDIHGQNDNQSILDITTHIELLDRYAQNDMQTFQKEYGILYKEYQNIKAELQKNYGDDKERERKLDLLNYQVKEIEEANLKIGEEETLEEKRKRMMSAEKIVKNLQEAQSQMHETGIDSLHIAIKALEKIEEYDEAYSKMIMRLKDCYYEIEEMLRDIDSFSEDIDFNEKEQIEVEERLDEIYMLKRKYGNTIAEILEYKNKVQQEIYEIENLEEYITSLKHKEKQIQEQMLTYAVQMHEVRKKYADKLSYEINQELKDLEMKNAKFSIENTFSENHTFTKNGLDTIEFMICTNTGEMAKPLVKIASGGEMSRIMLAIKNVLADVDETPILIFDEIDTGISGVAANATAEKMKKIAKKHQVICVTHLASIAAKADYHYYIGKVVENEKTHTTITLLDEENILKEIARIASGNVTEISLQHAKELKYGKLKETA